MNISCHIKFIFVIFALLLFPGCYKYRNTIKKETASLRTKTEEAINYDIDLDLVNKTEGQLSEDDTITVYAAVYQSIMGDYLLKSLLEQMGMSKADFAQAGYFGNPTLNFNITYPKGVGFLIFNYGFFGMNLNDFWQIPRKKKLAKTELEIATVSALNRILEIKADVETAYFAYLFEKMQLATAEKMETFRKKMQKNNSSDTSEDQNSYTHLIEQITNEIHLIEQQRTLEAATLDLRGAIGLQMNKNPIRVVQDEWQLLFETIPSPEKLFAYAKEQQPNIQIARMRIVEAQQQQAVARSKIFDNVQGGLGFFTTFGTPACQSVVDGQLTPFPATKTYVDLGPYVTMPIPLFDQQQAAIEKAKRQEGKARYDLKNLEGALEGEIYILYTNIVATRDKITKYKDKIMPAIDQSLKHAPNSEANPPDNFFASFSQLIDQEYLMNAEYKNLATQIIALEKIIGGSIGHVLAKKSNSAILYNAD